MNLGQMMMATLAMGMLGSVTLRTNAVVLESGKTILSSEFDATAIALAASVMEEASGTLFDEVITDSTVASLTSPSQLSTVLGPEGSERYRSTSGAYPAFDDFDDFNGLFLVFKSTRPEEDPATPGAHWEFRIPDIRSAFYVRVKVDYVIGNNPDAVAGARTWHKRMFLTLYSPTSKDTLRVPSLMSCWN